MQNSKLQKSEDSMIMLLACGVLAYVILRSFTLGITDDEAWSYYNVKKFWYVETLCTGNTHWFNFCAIKVALLLGLEKAWNLRWLSILSATAFIYSGLYFIKRVNEFYLKLLAFSFLFLNPYLLDYLSLARGYVTGLAFMGLSLVFLYKRFKYDTSGLKGFLALFFAGLSAIANFNFFYYFTAFSVLYFYSFYFKNGFHFLKDKRFYFETLYSFGIAFFVLRALLFVTECSNDIAGCGGEHLVDSVFGSYFSKSISKKFVSNDLLNTLLSYLLFIGIIVFSTIGIIRFKRHLNVIYFSSSAMLLLMLFLVIFNKVWFNVPYPIHRTTLMFFPLYTIVVVGFLVSLKIKGMVKSMIACLLIALFSVNFFLNINLNTTIDYHQQADADKAYSSLVNLKSKQVGICPELYFLYLKYYSVVNPELKGEMINTLVPIPDWLTVKKNSLEKFDYLILFPPYDLSYYKGDKIKLDAMNIYPDTRVLIVKVTKLKQ